MNAVRNLALCMPLAPGRTDRRGSTLLLEPQVSRRPSNRSLREWEQRLPDRQFVRIHRSMVVNLNHVERLESWSHASQRV